MASLLQLPTELKADILDHLSSHPPSLLSLASTHSSFYKIYLSSKRQYQLEFLSEHFNVALLFALAESFFERRGELEDVHPPHRFGGLSVAEMTEEVEHWRLPLCWKDVPVPVWRASGPMPQLISIDSVDNVLLDRTARLHRRMLDMFSSLDVGWRVNIYGETEELLMPGHVHSVWLFYYVYVPSFNPDLRNNKIAGWIVDIWDQYKDPQSFLAIGRMGFGRNTGDFYSNTAHLREAFRLTIANFLANLYYAIVARRTTENLFNSRYERKYKFTPESASGYRYHDEFDVLANSILENWTPRFIHEFLWKSKQETLDTVKAFPELRARVLRELAVTHTGSWWKPDFDEIFECFGMAEMRDLEGIQVPPESYRFPNRKYRT